MLTYNDWLMYEFRMTMLEWTVWENEQFKMRTEHWTVWYWEWNSSYRERNVSYGVVIRFRVCTYHWMFIASFLGHIAYSCLQCSLHKLSKYDFTTGFLHEEKLGHEMLIGSQEMKHSFSNNELSCEPSLICCTQLYLNIRPSYLPLYILTFHFHLVIS